MAYKPLDEILDVIGEAVDILDVLKPVYNFKAPGSMRVSDRALPYAGVR